jgi:hypothetical protein
MGWPHGQLTDSVNEERKSGASGGSIGVFAIGGEGLQALSEKDRARAVEELERARVSRRRLDGTVQVD